MSTAQSPYDIDALTAKVRDRLGQEFDEEAAGRPGGPDDDSFLVDTEHSFDAPTEPAAPPVSAPPASGQGSGEEGEPAVTAPSSPDAPSITFADTEPIDPTTEPDASAPAEPEVVIAIPGLSDDAIPDPTLDDSAATAPDPAPEPTAPATDQFNYTRYFELAYGEVPPVEQVEAIFGFAERVNSLPPEDQQIIEAMLSGAWDPVSYARAILPSAPTASDDDDPYLNPSPAPAPAAAPSPYPPAQQQLDPRIAQQLAAARQMREQYILAGVQDAESEFRAAHPHIAAEDVRALMMRVNRDGGWQVAIDRGATPKEAYLRFMTATAMSDPQFASAIVAPSPAPAAAAPTTSSAQVQRQAANAAIAGTSSPAAPSPRRRRSPINSEGEPTREPASTPASADARLRDEARAAVARIMGE